MPLDDAVTSYDERAIDLLALDEALDRLSDLDPRMMRIIDLRFFGGLSEEETAAALDLSTRSVRRDWRTARAWLHSQLSKGGSHDALSNGSEPKSCLTPPWTDPAEERAALLDEACGDDAELRAAVRVAAGIRTTADRIHAAATRWSSHGAVDRGGWLPIGLGKRVGAYRLTDVISSGGMGTVVPGGAS